MSTTKFHAKNLYKRKRLQARLASLFLYSGLREFVEGECELALLVRSSILVNDTKICGKTIEVGYALHPDYHGRGFATESLGAVIPYLFAEGFDQVLAGAFETNTASMRVMEKSGLSRTKMTSEIEYRGKTHKCVYYSIKKN